MKSFALVLFVAGLLCCTCDEMANSKARAEDAKKSVSDVKSEIVEKIGERKERSYSTSLVGIARCLNGNGFDATCLMSSAEDVLVQTNRNFWAEADKGVSQAAERADDETKPSVLMGSISQIISELSDMFKDGLAGLFRDAKEGDDDDDDDGADDDSDETEDKDDKDSRTIEESRGKKKKKKKGIIKLLVLGAVVATKLKLLLKLLATHLQIKFLLIAVAGLLLNFARFYFDLKKGHQPQKVIYYEHAQHQHHYDGGEEDWHSGWSRSYNGKGEAQRGQDLAYAQQKPQGLVYNKINDKPNYSWDDGN